MAKRTKAGASESLYYDDLTFRGQRAEWDTLPDFSQYAPRASFPGLHWGGGHFVTDVTISWTDVLLNKDIPDISALFSAAVQRLLRSRVTAPTPTHVASRSAEGCGLSSPSAPPRPYGLVLFCLAAVAVHGADVTKPAADGPIGTFVPGPDSQWRRRPALRQLKPCGGVSTPTLGHGSERETSTSFWFPRTHNFLSSIVCALSNHPSSLALYPAAIFLPSSF